MTTARLALGVLLILGVAFFTLSRSVSWSEEVSIEAKCLEPTNEPTKNNEPSKLLYVFVALDQSPSRQAILRDNIEYIAASAKDSQLFSVHCILFSYIRYRDEPLWVRDIAESSSHICRVIRIFENRYVHFLKTLMPALLSEAKYQYITLSLNDVPLTGSYSDFDFEKYHQTVIDYRLEWATPAVKNGGWRWMAPQGDGLVHGLSGTEIQFTTFSILAWGCLYELIDTEYPSGWMIDSWFWSHCVETERVPGRIGVLDEFFVTHNPDQLPSTNVENARELMLQQMVAWKQERGITLPPWGQGPLELGILTAE